MPTALANNKYTTQLLNNQYRRIILDSRKAKIVVTIGPETQNEEKIEELISNGVNVFRMNFSHGTHESHKEIYKRIRKISAKFGIHTAILQDLAGPKIRLGEIKEPFSVHQNENIYFDKNGKSSGKNYLTLNNPSILKQLKKGDRIYIADGMIKLEVVETSDELVTAKVLVGGIISSKKGVNFPNVKLDIQSCTEKDIEDLQYGLELGFDYIALSFVRTADDVKNIKNIISGKKFRPKIIAKIEKHEAIENIDEILEVSDGLMVARGDLGVEIDLEKLPVLQKELILKANKFQKPVITATQMLTSMISSPRPTRAEVTDIANAVFDGTDAVMLSDETTVGKYPVEAVKVLNKTIRESEKYLEYFNYGIVETSEDSAIPSASCHIAENLGIKHIVVFTSSGTSALKVASYRPNVSILACCHSEETANRLALVWGVTPYLVLKKYNNIDKMIEHFIKYAYSKGDLDTEDKFLATIGYPLGVPGSTSTLRIFGSDDIKNFLNNK